MSRPKKWSLTFSWMFRELNYSWITASFFPLTDVASLPPSLHSRLRSTDSEWVTRGQNVVYRCRDADGSEICLSHRSPLAHGSACQPSQREPPQYSSRVVKQPARWMLPHHLSATKSNGIYNVFKMCFMCRTCGQRWVHVRGWWTTSVRTLESEWEMSRYGEGRGKRSSGTGPRSIFDVNAAQRSTMKQTLQPRRRHFKDLAPPTKTQI